MSAIGLPSELLALFKPCPLPQSIKVRGRRKEHRIGGIGDVLKLLAQEDPQTAAVAPMKIVAGEEETQTSAAEKPAKTNQENIDEFQMHLKDDSMLTIDPDATVFLARMSYSTTKKTLETIASAYGPIKQIRIVSDSENKPRGYAFIEFEKVSDAKKMLSNRSEQLIDGRKVVIDSERGRKQKGWLPRRLGGGLGNLRRAEYPKSILRAVKRRRMKLRRTENAFPAKRMPPKNRNFERRPPKRSRRE